MASEALYRLSNFQYGRKKKKDCSVEHKQGHEEGAVTVNKDKSVAWTATSSHIS